ncbi:MAG TPA: DUF6084 family protein [Jatrophihabitantaceae bacterium]|nr:DUF6084 family protein [Jatrophihabitantaceae bacterium]
MPEFTFTCTGAEPDLAAAAPTIALGLQITETTGETVHALALRTQLRIEPLARRYDDSEADAMRDLFGERARWGRTLKPLQFGFVNQMVPTFTGQTTVDVALPCSYDFDVAANKYLYALEQGEIPLLLLFSGTVFTAAGNGFSVSLVPWDREARYRLPVSVWKQTLDLHFPGTAWMRLGHRNFDALHRYRTEQQLTSWDDAIERLLKEAEG